MSMNEEAAHLEMPHYRCFKEVSALKILSAIPAIGGGASLRFADSRFSPITLKPGVVARYFPQPGDYYVVYADGYQSISPAKAFEEGYTRI
jgi:hypothetical protein